MALGRRQAMHIACQADIIINTRFIDIIPCRMWRCMGWIGLVERALTMGLGMIGGCARNMEEDECTVCKVFL